MNSRPPVPQTGALTRLRYAPTWAPLCPAAGPGSTAKPQQSNRLSNRSIPTPSAGKARGAGASDPAGTATAPASPSPRREIVNRERHGRGGCIRRGRGARHAQARQQRPDAAAVRLGSGLDPHPCLQRATLRRIGERRAAGELERRRARSAPAARPDMRSGRSLSTSTPIVPRRAMPMSARPGHMRQAERAFGAGEARLARRRHGIGNAAPRGCRTRARRERATRRAPRGARAARGVRDARDLASRRRPRGAASQPRLRQERLPPPRDRPATARSHSPSYPDQVRGKLFDKLRMKGLRICRLADPHRHCMPASW